MKPWLLMINSGGEGCLRAAYRIPIPEYAITAAERGIITG